MCGLPLLVVDGLTAHLRELSRDAIQGHHPSNQRRQQLSTTTHWV